MLKISSSSEVLDESTSSDSKFPLDKGFHRRKLKASLWLAEKRQSSKAVIWLLTAGLYLLGGSSAHANPDKPTGENLLARRSSSRLRIQDLLNESDVEDKGKGLKKKSKKSPPKPDGQEFSSIPKPEVTEETREELSGKIELDYRSLPEDFNWTHDEGTSLNDFTIDTEELLPLEKLWDSAGNLVENSINRVDREWRAYKNEDDIRENSYSESQHEEINLWKSFQKEVCRFLSPKIRVSGLKIRFINSWENNNLSIRIQTSVRPDNGFLHDIKARAEYRTEILEGLFRVIAKYRFRPQDPDSGSLEARFDKSFSDHCSGFISTSAHLNGEQRVEFGFIITFGGPQRSSNSGGRYKTSRRISKGAKARQKVSPEPVLTRIGRKADSTYSKEVNPS